VGRGIRDPGPTLRLRPLRAPASSVTAVEAPLFVYGTLRSGASHASLLDQFADRREPATTCGVAVDRGAGYPVAKFGGKALLHGELVWLRVDRIDEGLRRLDEYEGTEFRRVVVDVATANGVVRAYAYEDARVYAYEDASRALPPTIEDVEPAP
jgi:gamma-glutamylcyclotransferase (GGCT)/AIG2-like uncharacterized protein YtfP